MPLLGIDNLPGSAHLETMEIPRRVCFLFGQEGPGLSDAAREACDGTFSIAQFGSTRSINASAAAAIAMHAWVRAHADLGDESAWRGGNARALAGSTGSSESLKGGQAPGGVAFTGASLIPISAAVSATDRSSQCRSTTAASPSAFSRVTEKFGYSSGDTPAHRITSSPSLKVPIGTSVPASLRSQAW